MDKTRGAIQTLMQLLAILLLALLWGMILHKGYGDISLIAERHSGLDFWQAVAKYLIGNLAGGKSAGDADP